MGDNRWFLPAGPGQGIHVSNPGIWHRVYWDNFSGCPVSVREEIAPPERYTEVVSNPADVYIEHWAVTRNGTDARCDVAYSKTSYSIPAMVDSIRDGCFDGAVPVRMIRWEVPKDHYERILKRMEE